MGQTDGRAIVVQSIDELSAVDFNRDIYLYSQTTKSIEGFHNLIEEIKSAKAQAPHLNTTTLSAARLPTEQEH